MSEILYVGFKGKTNSSYQLVQALNGQKLFLTNSFQGVKSDIDALQQEYRAVFMFGLDKNLFASVRLDACAVCGNQLTRSYIDLFPIKQKMNEYKINCEIFEHPSRFLCNAAYYQMLRKTDGKAVFFHIPPMRYLPEGMFLNMVNLFNDEELLNLGQ